MVNIKKRLQKRSEVYKCVQTDTFSLFNCFWRKVLVQPSFIQVHPQSLPWLMLLLQLPRNIFGFLELNHLKLHQLITLEEAFSCKIIN